MAITIDSSSLRSAGTRLEVIGNNISNSSTVGFKQSEFENQLTASMATDIGSKIGGTRQLLSKGSIVDSSNPLDMAIDGRGFFRVLSNGSVAYTRDGQFALDKAGNIVNSAGDFLTGYGVDANNKVVPGVLTSLKIDTSDYPPTPTATATLDLSLDTRKTAIDAALNPFNPADPATYSHSTASTVYDAQGSAHDVRTFYIKTAADKWDVYATVDGEFSDTTQGKLGSLSFGSNGALLSGDSFSAPAGASQSVNVQVDRNLSQQALEGSVLRTTFDPDVSSTYSTMSSREVYDASGTAHTVQTFYVKTSAVNVDVFASVDGTLVGSDGKFGTFITDALGKSSFSSVDVLAPAKSGVYQVPIGVKSIAFDVSQSDVQTVVAEGSAEAVIDTAVNPFDPTDDSTYSKLVNSQIYDGAGTVHDVKTFYVKSSDIRADVYLMVDGKLAGSDGKIGTYVANDNVIPWTYAFGSNGVLNAAADGGYQIPVGGASQGVTLDMSKAVQYASDFMITQEQDGGAQGRMESYNVDAEGLITVSYSNGQRTTMGQVLLATFPSSENLAQIGASQWRESVGSGTVSLNTPGVGGLGVLKSSSKEESNVDLTSEMIKMIAAQRIFQAAAEMVKKQDETLQTVVNLARS